MLPSQHFTYRQCYFYLDTLAYCNLYYFSATVYFLSGVAAIDVYYFGSWCKSVYVSLRSFKKLSKVFHFDNIHSDYTHLFYEND